MSDQINVTLNTFDNEGNVVDTDNMDLKANQVSDIIDQAAQLILLRREGKVDDVELAVNELEEALDSAGVI